MTQARQARRRKNWSKIISRVLLYLLLVVLSFVFLTPLIYLNSPELYTISLALRTFADPAAATDWGAIFAMSSLSLVPVFIIFVAFQRYLVEGISTTGLKG